VCCNWGASNSGARGKLPGEEKAAGQVRTGKGGRVLGTSQGGVTRVPDIGARKKTIRRIACRGSSNRGEKKTKTQQKGGHCESSTKRRNMTSQKIVSAFSMDCEC